MIPNTFNVVDVDGVIYNLEINYFFSSNNYKFIPISKDDTLTKLYANLLKKFLSIKHVSELEKQL